MICINGKQYSGNIARNDEKVLSVILTTMETFQDVLANLNNVDKVVETVGEETQEITVSFASHAKMIQSGMYLVEFSKELPINKKMEAQLKAQSEVIDQMLVMLLER